MKRVLVTGASGFIGRQTLPLLRERGFDVHAVSLRDEVPAEGVTWHHVDLLDAEARQNLLKTVQPTHVLHFAWIATPGIYWTSPLNTQWQEATLDLLALSTEIGVRRFVGSGSCAEYDWQKGHCDEALTPLLPTTPYGIAKAFAGKAVMEASKDGLSTAWGRVFLLYGPHEYPERLVPSIILPLLKGKRAQCSHGKQIRDFLQVRDVADAFVSLLESDVAGAVNIASGAPVSIRTVVETIAKQLHTEDRIDFGALEAPANDPPILTAEVRRLREEVGWSPSMSVEEGIAETIAWWKSQRS